MLDKIIAAAVGAGILGSAYLLDLLIGIVKVIFTPDLKWSWKKMFQDLVKAIIWATGVTVSYTHSPSPRDVEESRMPSSA